jgi:hypothetical protein
VSTPTPPGDDPNNPNQPGQTPGDPGQYGEQPGSGPGQPGQYPPYPGQQPGQPGQGPQPGQYGQQDPGQYGQPYPGQPGGPGQQPYGYNDTPAAPPSNTPMILSIIGIVCWFCCSPAAIGLGLYAQSKYREQGQSDTLAKVAWIGGIVALAIGIIGAVNRYA